MEELSIKAEYITTFLTFNEWVGKASSRIGGFPRSEIIVCIDRFGNSCNIGEDFMNADKRGFFPVKAYRLIRTIEYVKD